MKFNNQPESNEQRRFKIMLGVAITSLILGVVLFYFFFLNQNHVPRQMSTLPQIVNALKAGEVKTLTVRGNLLVAEKSNGRELIARKEPEMGAVETLQLLGASPETLANLPLVVESPPSFNIGNALLLILPLALAGYLFFFAARRMKNNNPGSLFTNIRRSNPRLSSMAAKNDVKMNLPRVTFADVAGIEQAKFELQEVVEFLKDPGKFTLLGARIPRGVLMVGPPGTGKTLMAKAVAGEANVPFFSISGSEFVEMFVGVGAARVRDLFKRASEQAPAVVFVDEIDAVGRQRGFSLGNGNDEREQTLNQVLVEMDGFESDTRIIVIAATNRPDILDPALLRPGRFDRKVILDRPDVHDREAILKVHVQGKPLARNISLVNLARLTPGFVGADLENLVNEAAILAARRNLRVIGQQEFQDAMERIVAGPEHKNKIISPAERKIVAIHEAGHALVMHNLEHSDPVHKVSIMSRGMALGYTMPLPEGDQYLRSQKTFEDELAGLLGGRAAEEIVFEEVTTGGANDLERATKLARAMVTRYGFSPKLGLRTFGEEQGNPYLGSLGEVRDYSEEMAHRIDDEVGQILDRAYQRAKQIISHHQVKLETLAEVLLKYETIDRTQFESLMA